MTHQSTSRCCGAPPRSRADVGRNGGCRLEAGPLKDVANWVVRYRRFWEESLECLDQHLKEVQPVEKPEPEGDPADATARGN